MAAEVRAFAKFLIFSIIVLLFICKPLGVTSASEVTAQVVCKAEDYQQLLLPCNQNTRKRKAVYYLKSKCNPKLNGSVAAPSVIENLPCECAPGYGEVRKSNFNISCQKCQSGEYSHGGELISDWKDWNGTKGVPGSGFKLHVYCSDFMSKKPCTMWRPEGNGEYIVSGNPKNASELRCFEQSILVLNRVFVGEEGNNYMEFEYKVDGSACRREESSSCNNGLYVVVQNKKTSFKSDYQFQWLKQRIDLKPGPNQIKFVYQRSCTKEAVLDVAYIKHLALVGTASANTVCSQCPEGSFSNITGSKECIKCRPNEFQDIAGQETCKQCPENHFSRIGEVKCYKLPNCTRNDFYLLPALTSSCKNVGGKWMREQEVKLPQWPGKSKKSCVELNNPSEESYKRPGNPDVQCQCSYSAALNVTGSQPKCTYCPLGSYSDGTLLQCAKCAEGSAAIPGYYLNMFAEGNPPGILKQECSGDFCSKAENSQFWEHRGDYMATKRLPGNFETTISFHDIPIDYYDARIFINCSVDCRITAGESKLAKHDHCYLKMIILKNNETIKDIDCVSKYRSQYRNGTIRKHHFPLKGPGSYTFKVFFHHEDEAYNSLVSYEARIHGVEISGARSGSAKSCKKCIAGTRVSDDSAFCEKCPPGTYSNAGATKCTPCLAGYFSSKNGSKSCTKCGSGTKSNLNKDGCDYNGCKFRAAEGVDYDLSPLTVRGGPMHRVKTYVSNSHHYFPVLYYINLCSYEHDNTSCMVTIKELNQTSRKYEVVESRSLKTMACKRWGFDTLYSYSIGEVLNFIPLKDNLTGGLMINLTGGYRCWHREHKVLSVPSTSILMICDLYRGVGQPEPRSNASAIDDKNCHFQLSWRTTYACPMCTEKDYSIVYSQCNDEGSQTVTYSRVKQCRTEKDVYTKLQSCEKSGTSAPLIATVVIALIFIVILVVFVVYYVRRNRDLRDKLFVPGKAFSKVQDEDAEELVDNMIS